MPAKENIKGIQLPPELISYIISLRLADEIFTVAKFHSDYEKPYYDSAKSIATASTHLFGFVYDRVEKHLGIIGKRVDAIRQLRTKHRRACSVNRGCDLCQNSNMLVSSEELLYEEVKNTNFMLRREWKKMKHLYGVKEMTLWVV